MMHVLIVGAGMYVCGRGTDGFGTVLPTLLQMQKEGKIGSLNLAATSEKSVRSAKEKLAGLQKIFDWEGNVSFFTSYQDALQKMDKPACAIVVVPDSLHASIALDILKGGVHALVVKPLAPTLIEAKNLVKTARENNVYGGVEFHKRFDEANLLLKKSFQDGKLGNLRYVTVEFSQKRIVRDIFQDWIDKTNIFQYLGVHYADLIHFVTGAFPLRVLAVGKPSGPVHDSIQTIIEWQADLGESFSSTITPNWIDSNTSSAMSDQKVTFVGTLGRYQSDQKNRGVQVVTEKGIEDINPYFSQIYPDAIQTTGIEGYGPRCIRQFVADAVHLDTKKIKREALVKTRPSFEAALVSTAIVEAVNKSLSEKGTWIYLSSKELYV